MSQVDTAGNTVTVSPCSHKVTDTDVTNDYDTPLTFTNINKGSRLYLEYEWLLF